MANFNKVIIAGYLTRDPELRYTPKGTAVARITLALNRTYSTEGGEKKEEVSFVDVEAWGRQAEVIGQYLKKGRPLLVEGRLKQDTWEKDGQKHSKLKVVLESFSFIDSGERQSGMRKAESGNESGNGRFGDIPRTGQGGAVPAEEEPPAASDVPF